MLPGWDVQPFGGELPEETGETFVENALLKARHVHAAIGGSEWVLADDSGIEAAALGGVPGVRSARYAGEDATDEQNLAEAARRARGPRTIAASATSPSWSRSRRTARSCTARGELTGTLADTPRGTGGFGYDPAFVPDGETRTVAEMAPEREGRDLAPRPRGRARSVPSCLKKRGQTPGCCTIET